MCQRVIPRKTLDILLAACLAEIFVPKGDDEAKGDEEDASEEKKKKKKKKKGT